MAEVTIRIRDVIHEGKESIAFQVEADPKAGHVEDSQAPSSPALAMGMLVKRLYDSRSLHALTPLGCADLIHAMNKYTEKKKPRIFKPTANDIADAEKTKR